MATEPGIFMKPLPRAVFPHPGKSAMTTMIHNLQQSRRIQPR